MAEFIIDEDKQEEVDATKSVQDLHGDLGTENSSKNVLQLNVNKLEAKKTELQKTTTELQQHLAELQENNTYRDNLNPEVKQEIISTNDVFIPSPNMIIDYQQNENETLHYPSQVEPSFRTLIFDTTDLF